MFTFTATPAPAAPLAVSVTVGDGSGYTVGSPATGSVAVRDDDLPPPVVSVAAKASSVVEGNAAAFTITADRAPDADLTVKLSVPAILPSSVPWRRRPAVPSPEGLDERSGVGNDGGGRPDPELDRLSNIIAAFNDLFGDITWEDGDRVRRLITEEIPSRAAVDTAFRNARENSDKQNARIEHDRALLRVMTAVMRDDTELFKQFMDNEGFQRWMSDTVFGLAYERPTAP